MSINKDDRFTPALRQISIEKINDILSKEITSIVNQKKYYDLTFEIVMEKLLHDKYETITEFQNDVYKIIITATKSSDVIVEYVGKELQKTLSKFFKGLFDLSHYKFRTFMKKYHTDLEFLLSFIDVVK